MNVAIMQPYIFPYIGYFQLISKVDKFIIYDDVTFIKQGWINRNYILAGGKPLLFTMPLEDVSSNKLIKETKLHSQLFPSWRTKFLKTIEQNYKKAPYYNIVFEKIRVVFESESLLMSRLLRNGLIMVSTYLEIKTTFVDSSESYFNDLKGEDRIIAICKKENATAYYNLIGGKDLYTKQHFESNGIELHFIKPKKNIIYKQGFSASFFPWLSIIDVLMYNSPEKIIYYLGEHEIS